MSSRSLNDLDSRMLPLVREVQSRCALAGVPTTIITTLRSMEEQKQAVAHGVSWTLKGMHLAHPPENKSLAVDLAPTELLIRAAHPGAREGRVVAREGRAVARERDVARGTAAPHRQ